MPRVYIHALPVRIWHWTNASSCVMLALTGLQIRYIGTIDVVSFRTAVMVHNIFGFIVTANFFLWLTYYALSDKRVNYLPNLQVARFIRGAMRQAEFYAFGVFKGEPNPHHVTKYHQFNPLQAMTYQIITGILLWNLTGLANIVAVFGGVRVVDTVHVLIFAFFLFFIPFHVYLASMGHTPLADYKAMWDGYEEEEEGEASDSVE